MFLSTKSVAFFVLFTLTCLCTVSSVRYSLDAYWLEKPATGYDGERISPKQHCYFRFDYAGPSYWDCNDIVSSENDSLVPGLDVQRLFYSVIAFTVLVFFFGLVELLTGSVSLQIKKLFWLGCAAALVLSAILTGTAIGVECDAITRYVVQNDVQDAHYVIGLDLAVYTLISIVIESIWYSLLCHTIYKRRTKGRGASSPKTQPLLPQ